MQIVTHRHLKIVGHRGARALAPENTIAAIKKALQHNVDEVEIDVRITKDMIPVLHHDKNCSDASGALLPIRFTSYAELKRHKPDLATLAEAIAATAHLIPVQIEVKRGEPTEPVVTVILQAISEGTNASNILIGSKSHRTLMELHHGLPAIATVVIEPFMSVRAVWRAKQLNTKRLSMKHIWMWSGFIRAMHHRGYELYAYTLNDPAKAKRWQSYGLQGVITDSPDLYEPSRSSPRRVREA